MVPKYIHLDILHKDISVVILYYYHWNKNAFHFNSTKQHKSVLRFVLTVAENALAIPIISLHSLILKHACYCGPNLLFSHDGLKCFAEI